MNFVFRFLMLFCLITLLSFDGKDCISLKNSSFSYRNQGNDVLVIFKETEHVEYHNNKEFFIKSDITWLNNCEYYLTIKETTLPNFPFKMGEKLHIEVTKVKGKKVYYKSTLGGRSWEGRLTKLKNPK
jgi:hypothetical protein